MRSGIPAYDQTRVGKYVWNEQAESLLGSMSDGALAKILSIATQSVQQARAARGVAKFEPARDTVPKIRGPREQKDLEKSPRGRKPLAAGEGKTARVQMKVRPAQKSEWQAKADAAGLALQVWIEQQCDRLR